MALRRGAPRPQPYTAEEREFLRGYIARRFYSARRAYDTLLRGQPTAEAGGYGFVLERNRQYYVHVLAYLRDCYHCVGGDPTELDRAHSVPEP